MHWYYNAFHHYMSSAHNAPTTTIYTVTQQFISLLARIQTNSFSNSLAQSSKSESSASPSEEEEFLSIALPFALPGTFSVTGVGPCDDPFGDATADDELLLFATTVLESCDFRDLAVWIRFARRERRSWAESLGVESLSESSASETSRDESPFLFRFRLFRRDSDWFDATLILTFVRREVTFRYQIHR